MIIFIIIFTFYVLLASYLVYSNYHRNHVSQSGGSGDDENVIKFINNKGNTDDYKNEIVAYTYVLLPSEINKHASMPVIDLNKPFTLNVKIKTKYNKQTQPDFTLDLIVNRQQKLFSIDKIEPDLNGNINLTYVYDNYVKTLSPGIPIEKNTLIPGKKLVLPVDTKFSINSLFSSKPEIPNNLHTPKQIEVKHAIDHSKIIPHTNDKVLIQIKCSSKSHSDIESEDYIPVFFESVTAYISEYEPVPISKKILNSINPASVVPMLGTSVPIIAGAAGATGAAGASGAAGAPGATGASGATTKTTSKKNKSKTIYIIIGCLLVASAGLGFLID